MNENQEERAGFDRRAFIRRSAVVGAATVWVAPTVQSLTAPAFALGTPAGGCTACLTGGGQIVSKVGAPVTYNGSTIPSLSFGVGQLCCEGQGPITIEVNAHTGGQPKDDISWHFDENLQLTCSKTGDPAPGPNTSECANTFTGTVQDGNGNTLTFTFSDFGEPGQMVDVVSISISGPQGTLTGAGYLDRGNLQVHESLGPIHRDCSGC